uniref:Cadherin domain-containing protein n=1 Tax=Panagrolaimus sp. PS1159 TaxID=55785 RepID=A0AC35GT72_9BILA
MKNTWLRYFNKYFLQFFIFTTFIQLSVAQECKFPESEIEPFFFDIKADLPPDSVIVDTAVDPPDAQLRLINVRSNNLPDVYAQLRLVNVRSNNLPEIDYTEKFDIEQRARGQFMVLSRSTLQLPRYPSSFNETYLYMTVLCNNQAYPLITVRVRNFNSFSPKFYNEPYEVVLPGKSTVNTLISTPLLALDSDPEIKYPITYKIESGQYSDEFALIASRTDFHPIKSLPKQFRTNSNWRPEQLPPIVKLHVQQQPRDHEYRLNISATDSGTPPKKTFATLRVIIGTIRSTEYLKFTQKEYYANFSKLMTVDTEILPNTVILADITEQTPKRKRSRV